jgi:hypothetical protein
MGYFRKIVGEQLYLSPFDTEDIDLHFIWAKWMNDRVVSDHYGGHHNLVSLATKKRVSGKPGGGASGYSKTENILIRFTWIYWPMSLGSRKCNSTARPNKPPQTSHNLPYHHRDQDFPQWL